MNFGDTQTCVLWQWITVLTFSFFEFYFLIEFEFLIDHRQSEVSITLYFLLRDNLNSFMYLLKTCLEDQLFSSHFDKLCNVN